MGHVADRDRPGEELVEAASETEMADDKTKTGKPDRNRINTSES
jgi:hypothetical protein